MFNLHITIVGIGMGNPDTLTVSGLTALRRARTIIGAKRLLESLPKDCKAEKLAAISPQEIKQMIDGHAGLGEVAVVMSGDTGFYSGAERLLPLLSEFKVDLVCGITTVQYLAAKLRRSWQNVSLVSAHGVECNIVGSVLKSDEVFFLTGGKITPDGIVDALIAADLGDVETTVGERLSYEDEVVTTCKAKELCGHVFAPLSAVWVRRDPSVTGRNGHAVGIPDDRFVRGSVPMTKQEVRAAIHAKLAVRENDVVYDVGAGTGSVSVELALFSPMIRVFAVECSADACALIGENRRKFGAYNLTLVEGRAPDALEGLPAPDRAFVGGSSGGMREILSYLLNKNPGIRVVISAITVETLGETLGVLKELAFDHIDVSQISVSRSKDVGRYHLMTAQNPVFLLSADGMGATDKGGKG